MRIAIVIGTLGLAILANQAAAQTATEQARILGDFHRTVTDYAQRHQGLELIPAAPGVATPAPKIFTLPVSVVFRQLIDTALAAHAGTTTIEGVGAPHRAIALLPLPATELTDFPRILADALPRLPEPLEYRLVARDLVIRDANGDVIVAVLRDAVGAIPTKR